MSSLNYVVELNVGGMLYSTLSSTLLNSPFAPSNLFHHLLKDESASAALNRVRDSNGRLFIDRDGVLFGLILQYLRTGRCHWTETNEEQVMDEALYYSIELPRLPPNQACRLVRNKWWEYSRSWFHKNRPKLVEMLTAESDNGHCEYSFVWKNREVPPYSFSGPTGEFAKEWSRELFFCSICSLLREEGFEVIYEYNSVTHNAKIDVMWRNAVKVK